MSRDPAANEVADRRPCAPPRRWRVERAHLLLAHRYLGLVIAAFLCCAGLTGSLLAWKDSIEAAAWPSLRLVAAPSPSARPMDPLVLRQLALARHPGAEIADVPLAAPPAGRPVDFFLDWSGAGPSGAARDDEILMDPYTGRELGSRRWGDIGQGRRNLVPFLYRLHYSLALDAVGTRLFGVVALLWTLTCVAGLWLSLPARGAAGGLRRWRAAWRVRWRDGGFRRLFDLHRAGALWTWALLLVFAWSAVSFNLHEVYRPAMGAVLAYQPADLPPARPDAGPAMPWPQARERGRALMAQEAARHGFVVREETALGHDADSGAFCYEARSSLDPGTIDGRTRVCFDATDGRALGAWLPTGAAAGDTLETWLGRLHRARVGGTPWRVAVSTLGLAVAMLSITGVLLWWRKRGAKRAARPAV